MENNVFKTLSEIDVKSKVEKKGNQEYLSWSHAWAMVKQFYPDMQRIIYEDYHTGVNYFNDGKTCYVKVGIIINGLEHIDYLPVMDFKNQSIPLERVTSMDVNKTIQRSTTKALALHGAGLSLWSGEDLIDSVKTSKPASTSKIDLAVNDTNWAGVVKYVEANKTKLDLATIVKNLSVKYNLSTSVKKTLGDLLK
jgi:hypothetical protein